ncbi:hypothetical protein ES708_07930 [subsurface metagenome]
MGIKRRQYSREFKEEIVQKTLSGKSVLEFAKKTISLLGLSTASQIRADDR